MKRYGNATYMLGEVTVRAYDITSYAAAALSIAGQMRGAGAQQGSSGGMWGFGSRVANVGGAVANGMAAAGPGSTSVKYGARIGGKVRSAMTLSRATRMAFRGIVKGAGNVMSAVSVFFTFKSAVDSGGMRPHHFADLAVTAGFTVAGIFAGAAAAPWIAGAALVYFAADVISYYTTGSSLTENIFDNWLFR